MAEALVVARENDPGRVVADWLHGRGLAPVLLPEGKHAHAHVRQRRPALVVLEPHLSDADSLEVCAALKLDHETNQVPVILLDDPVALNHRERGYRVCPDVHLSPPYTPEQLDRAVREALARRDELARQHVRCDIRFLLHSDLRYLDEFNKILSAHFLTSGLSEAEAKQLTMAVRELGANAIEWGNRRQVDRLVTIHYRIDPHKITLTIRDQGPGFNPCQCPHAASSDDPISHMEVRESLGLREGGFGILIVKGLVDEMQYNDCGNEVRLVKHFAARNAAAASESRS